MRALAVAQRRSRPQPPAQRSIDGDRHDDAGAGYEADPLATLQRRADRCATVGQLQALQRRLSSRAVQQRCCQDEAGPAMQPQSMAPPSHASSHGLPEGVRQQMEHAFGTSFGDVTVQRNSERARQVGALAFTQGSQLHFAPGQFRPDTLGGRELIGHELEHVMQQRAGLVQPTLEVGGMAINDEPSLERRADHAGRRAARIEVGGSPAQAKAQPGAAAGARPVAQMGGGNEARMFSRMLRMGGRMGMVGAGLGLGLGLIADQNRRRRLGIESVDDFDAFQDMMNDRQPDTRPGSSVIVPADRGLNPFGGFSLPMIYTPFLDRDVLHSHTLEVRMGDDGVWRIVDDRGFMGADESEGVTNEHEPFRSPMGTFDLSRFNFRTSQIVPGTLGDLVPRTMARGSFCSPEYRLLFGANNCQTFSRMMLDTASERPAPSLFRNPVSYLFDSIQSGMVAPQVSASLGQQVPFDLPPSRIGRMVEVADLLNPVNLRRPNPMVDEVVRRVLEANVDQEVESQRGASLTNWLAFGLLPLPDMIHEEVFSQTGMPLVAPSLLAPRRRSRRSRRPELTDAELQMLLFFGE